MTTPNAKGYLLAVALFLVCCWANPNDAIPHRTRPQAKEQVDQRVGNRAEINAVNVTHRSFLQPDLWADEKPAPSSRSKKFRSSQRSRSPRSRIKNTNVNVNTNKIVWINRSTSRLPKISESTSRSPEIEVSTSPLPKIDESTSRLSHIDESTSRLPKISGWTSRLPKIQVSTSSLPEIEVPTSGWPNIGGSISRLPNIVRSTSRLPNIDASISQLHNIDESTSRLREINESISGLLDIEESTSRLPIMEQSNTGLVKKNRILNRWPRIDSAAAGAADHDASMISMEPLTIQTTNCSEPHNKNDRYSSSFNGNLTVRAMNVGDEFQVSGEVGAKKTSSVHVGEDITLCWIETTTIKEDRRSHPVQRFVIREYTISFENSATIPERYLECVRLEGEVNGKNDSFPRSTLFEVMDENTRHSRVVNFTTVSHSDDLVVWQHRRVRCGVGPVVTKNIIEWADDSSEDPKKRVEIKVSPKTHRLIAQPTDTEPCTTDLVDSQLTTTTPKNPPSHTDCGPGITCGSYSDCVDESCGYSSTLDRSSTNSVGREQTPQLELTTSTTDEETDVPISTITDHESTEFSSTGRTNEVINSSKEMTTPVGGDKTVDDQTWTMTTLFETSNFTESSSVLSVTLHHDPNGLVEIGNQEVETPAISEESDSSTTEFCEGGGSCADFSTENSTTSGEEFSNSEIKNPDTATRRDAEVSNTEESSATPTTKEDQTESPNSFFRSTTMPTEITTSIESSSTTLATVTNGTLEHVTNVNVITDDSMLGFNVTEFGTTEISTTEAGGMLEYTKNGTLSPIFTNGVSVTEETTAAFGDATSGVSTLSIALNGDTTMAETAKDDSDVITPVTVSSTMLGGDKITEEYIIGMSGAPSEVTVSPTTLGDETAKEENVTDISDATTRVSTLSITLNSDTTMQETGTNESNVTTAVTVSPTVLDSDRITEEYTTSTSDATPDVTTSSTTLGDEIAKGENITDIGDATTEVSTLLITLNDDTTIPETVTNDSNATTAVTVSSTLLDDDTKTEEYTTGISDAAHEVTTSSTTFGGVTTGDENITDISDATTEVSTLLTTLNGDTTMPGTVTNASDVTTAVTVSSTVLDGDTITEEYTTGISDAATEVTESSNTLGGETTMEVTATGITDQVTESSTTEENQSEFTGRSAEQSTQALTEVYLGDTTTDIGGVTTEIPTSTTDSEIREITDTDLLTTMTEADLETTTETISIVNSTDNSATDGITNSIFTTTNANEDMSTSNVREGTTETTAKTVTVTSNKETVNDYSTQHSTLATTTIEGLGCDPSTGECHTTQAPDVTPITSHSCDPESDNCDSEDDSTTSSCDEQSDDCFINSSSLSTTSCDDESGDCSFDSSSSSTKTCDDESDDCYLDSSPSSTTTCDDDSDDCMAGSMSSSTTCDDDSDDCTFGSSSMSTTACDSESSASCTGPSDMQRDATSDSTGICDNGETENCSLSPGPREITDPLSTISTPIEVENSPTTISDVPTTVKAMSNDSEPKHKLALRIKILLEHIDDNQKKQKLVEVEKHLLFNESPNEHGTHSLMEQVRSLNNTISMQTVQALFNCSAVEKLTGDVGDFAARYLAMHGGIRAAEGPNSNSGSSEDPHVRKQRDLSPPTKMEVDPNVEISLPGIHADIHSGLGHVMTRVSSENEIEPPSVGLIEEEVPRSRILEVVADPQDKRVHGRRKRQTIADLAIDQRDLPKDIEEVGHWSNERVKRAINGGHVRTLTEFTIYKSP